MTKTFLDESICHLMDTKRPNYERLVDRMAPKFTKGWSKLEKKKKKKYIVQFKSFGICEWSHIFLSILSNKRNRWIQINYCS